MIRTGHMRAINDPADAAKFAVEVKRGISPIAPIASSYSARARPDEPRSALISISASKDRLLCPARVLAAIQDELEEAPTLYTIDVVDFARATETFRNVARQRIPL
jgi:class 3 adenylate cyclase